MHWDLQQMFDQFFNETESSIILVIIDHRKSEQPKKNEVYLGYQLSSSKTSNPAIGWQHNNTPYNWKSTLKCFTVLHHCKTIFLNLEIFTGAILSLFSFLSARQYCVIKNSEQHFLWFLTVFIQEWNNGLDRRANIIHWIWFWLYRWECLLHSKCLPRVMFFILSEFRLRQYRDGDHWEDVPHFTILTFDPDLWFLV